MNLGGEWKNITNVGALLGEIKQLTTNRVALGV